MTLRTALAMALLLVVVTILPVRQLVRRTASATATESPEVPGDRITTCALLLESVWDQLALADAEAAARSLHEAKVYAPCRPIAREVEWHYLSGRVALLAGDAATALAELESARTSPSAALGDRPGEAEILYYLGLAHQALGQNSQAIVWYRELAARHPADPRVALLLPSLPQAAVQTPQERLDAALHAVESHNYSAAERFLEGILSQDLARPVQPFDPDFQSTLERALVTSEPYLGEAAYQLGYLWYYWMRRDNDRAPPLLHAVAGSEHPRRADAAYFLARSYMRAEDYEAAREAWASFAEQYPRDRRRHEATYYSGWLYLDREQFEEALPGFETYLDRYPRGDRADRAEWYLGWSQFRLRRFPEARTVFHRMANRGGYLFGAKGQYWEARCFQEEGRNRQAEETFAAVADRYAFTYYGLLARQRLGEPLVPPRDHTPPVSPMDRLAQLALDDRALGTLQALIEADLAYRARSFYESRGLDEHPDDWLDRFLVRHAVGDAYDGWREARRRAGEALRRPPTRRTLRAWVQSYPRPFARWVETAAAEFTLDPLLVWSHMQIESHYNPTFVSYADAEGLMQIIPKTGQLIAEALQEPYAEGMLMHPVVNLRYAAWYLSALQREFSGQLPLAITAYNSGAHSMQRWVDENADLEFDAFIEEISYDQSREYVKRVIGIYAHYLYLYAEDEVLDDTLARLLPTHVDPGYRGEVTW